MRITTESIPTHAIAATTIGYATKQMSGHTQAQALAPAPAPAGALV